MSPVAYSGQKDDRVGLQATGNEREHVQGRAIGLAQRPDVATSYAIATVSAPRGSTGPSWLREVMSSFLNTLRRW
jgi:hypothetical protein